MYPEKAAGGTWPELNCFSDTGGWAFLKARQTWDETSFRIGTPNDTTSLTGAASQRASKEVYEDPTRSVFMHDSLHCSRGATTIDRSPGVVKPVGKKAKVRGRLGASGSGTTTRWENHNKKTCKCAVCMQCRGELKSSWYKHDQSTCACAVCRQSRGESRTKGTPPVEVVRERPSCRKELSSFTPIRNNSWVSELVCCRGGIQTPSRIGSQLCTFPSCNNTDLNPSLAFNPVCPEGCPATDMPSRWQRQLSSLTGREDRQSLVGINSSPLLVPTPKSILDPHHERQTHEQGFGSSCQAENSNAEQQPFLTHLHSNPSFAGWQQPDPTCSTNSPVKNVDSFRQYTTDCFNSRQSCESLSEMFCNRSKAVSWHNTNNTHLDVAATLHSAESLLFETRNMNVPFDHTMEPLYETSSVFSGVAERNGQWSTYSNLGNNTKTDRNVIHQPEDPVISHGQSATLLGGRFLSMAAVQPTAPPLSTILQDTDKKAAYLPRQFCNSFPYTLSGGSPSISRFPFGLEVQEGAENYVVQPSTDLLSKIHTQSSSTPYVTTSITSTQYEKNTSLPVTNVDCGDALQSPGAILQGDVEKLLLHIKDDGDEVSNEQSKRVGEKGALPTERAGQRYIKRCGNPVSCQILVQQKRAKRKGGSHHLPKWCQLIHSKFGHSTIIRTIYIRSRVASKRRDFALSRVVEPSLHGQNENAGSPTLSVLESNLEGRFSLEESVRKDGLQSTELTVPRAFTQPTDCVDGFTSAQSKESMASEDIENPHESVLCEKCSQESVTRRNSTEWSTATTCNDKRKDQRSKELKSYRKISDLVEMQRSTPVTLHHLTSRTEAGCNNRFHDEAEDTERVFFPSLSSISSELREDVPKADVPDAARVASRKSTPAMKDRLEITAQLADPLYQNVLVKASREFHGKKISWAHRQICIGRTESGLNCLRQLITQPEDTYLWRLLKAHCKGGRLHRASVSKSLLCRDMESVCKVDLAKFINSNGEKKLKIVNTTLYDPMRVYLTDVSTNRTSESTAWFLDIQKDLAHLSQSTPANHSLSWAPPKYIYPFLTPDMCSSAIFFLVQVLKLGSLCKSTGLVTWLKAQTGIEIQWPRKIAEVKVAETLGEIVTKSDAEVLNRFWHSFCTEKEFHLLVHSRLTVYMENLVIKKPLKKQIKEISSLLCSMKAIIFCFFWHKFGPNEVPSPALLLGGTRTKHKRMNSIDEFLQCLIQDGKLTLLRNIVFPCPIYKPLSVCRHLAKLGMLFPRSSSRLFLNCDGADQCVVSHKEEQIAEGLWKLLPSQFFSSENLKDNISAEGQHREQIFDKGGMPKEYVSLSVNSKQPSVQTLMAHEQTPGSAAFHAEHIDSIETISGQASCGSSFQDLLKSVLQDDVITSPRSLTSSERRTYRKEETCQIRSNECSIKTASLKFREQHSDLKNDSRNAAVLKCPPDSISKPFRRRGCPKGGWPKKNKAISNLYIAVANRDPMGCENATAQLIMDVEADIEVVQPTNIGFSNRDNGEFKKKLETFLEKPFQLQELKDLEEHACLRKPLLRLRETRQRVLHVATEREGLSYFDHHPDLARKVADAAPEESLRLLRGFFFWLQHACTSGSFKPWVTDVDEGEESDNDCVEIFPKERAVNHVHKMAIKVMATASTVAFRCDQTSASEAKEGMILRTRGRKRKHTLSSKQIKGTVETTVKREGK